MKVANNSFGEGKYMNKLWLVSLCLCMLAGSLQGMCQLKKVFHHRVPAEQGATTLELGSIVFYCTKHPEVKETTVSDDKSQKKMRFLFKDMKPNSEFREMMTEFNAVTSPRYRATLAARSRSEAIELTLEYNATKVAFSYEFFESITKDKGIIFRMYNQDLLNTLQKKEVSILKSAHNTRNTTIIIDCGHGGADYGAKTGDGVSEKDIVLSIGKKLSDTLQAAGFTVCMLRSHDTFLALDQRTARANAYGSSALFISLHANHAPSAQASGIETFCLDRSLFKSIHGLETTLDVMVAPIQQNLYRRSKEFAQNVHHGVITALEKSYGPIVDRHVRHAVAQVLVGTTMPGALLEVGFLSHPEEAKRLLDMQYQETIAQGIKSGILNFLHT